MYGIPSWIVLVAGLVLIVAAVILIVRRIPVQDEDEDSFYEEEALAQAAAEGPQKPKEDSDSWEK